MLPDDYDQRIADLAALARLHRFGQPHPWPAAECLMCQAINRRREELAQQCPESR